MKTDHVARVLKDRLGQVNKDKQHYEIRIQIAEDELSDARKTLAQLTDEKSVLEAELELRAMS